MLYKNINPDNMQNPNIGQQFIPMQGMPPQNQQTMPMQNISPQSEQPAPMQSLPLFLQQPTGQPLYMQQPTMPFNAYQQQMRPMAMNQIPAGQPVRFTDFEQLAMLENLPITSESLQYMNGFLRTQIGRRVKVEFLIGTNSFVDKEGTLLGVGVNYIIINETDTDDITVCDFYNIKFVRFYY